MFAPIVPHLPLPPAERESERVTAGILRRCPLKGRRGCATCDEKSGLSSRRDKDEEEGEDRHRQRTVERKVDENS
jgi:hypothetical protein